MGQCGHGKRIKIKRKGCCVWLVAFYSYLPSMENLLDDLLREILLGHRWWTPQEEKANGRDFKLIAQALLEIRKTHMVSFQFIEVGRGPDALEKIKVMFFHYDYYLTGNPNIVIVTLNGTSTQVFPDSLYQAMGNIQEICEEPAIRKQVDANERTIHQASLKKDML